MQTRMKQFRENREKGKNDVLLAQQQINEQLVKLVDGKREQKELEEDDLQQVGCPQ